MGSKGQTLHRHIQATLGCADFKGAVQLPEGEDINEWLAVNIVEMCEGPLSHLSSVMTRGDCAS